MKNLEQVMAVMWEMDEFFSIYPDCPPPAMVSAGIIAHLQSMTKSLEALEVIKNNLADIAADIQRINTTLASR